MAPSESNRRLTTILAADAEGFTRLMRADEEAARQTLKAHREVIDRLIARHDGRIFNTAGDSVLAEFGSAVEAVRCAIAVQEELAPRNAGLPADRRMHFRIGVNVGDVMVEGDDLIGDGVNVAARLQTLAEPGSVCISGTVYDQVGSKLTPHFEDLGPQQVKNIAEPVRAYRVVRGAGAPSAKERPMARAAPRWLWAAAAAVIVLLAGAGGGYWA